MFGLLRKLGFGDPAAEARRLNRDAAAILDNVEKAYSAATQGRIAAVIRRGVDEVHERSTGKLEYYERGTQDLTERNKAARGRNDQIAWSGLTLAIIHLKAEVAGEAALPARAAIADFVGRWRHTFDVEGGVADDASGGA